MTDLLTKDEAAKWLGFSVDTLDEIIRQGKIPIYRLGKRLVRVHREDLVRYVESCRVEAPAASGTKKRRSAPRICGYKEGMDVV